MARAAATFLREDGADRGGDHAVLTLRHMGEAVAHEVHAAALPRRLKHLGDRRRQALMRVRDRQLDGGEAALV